MWWERARGRANSPHGSRGGSSRRKKKVRWLNKGGSGGRLRAQPQATLPPVARERAAWSARFSNSDTFERASHVRFRTRLPTETRQNSSYSEYFVLIFVHAIKFSRRIAIETMQKYVCLSLPFYRIN